MTIGIHGIRLNVDDGINLLLPRYLIRNGQFNALSVSDVKCLEKKLQFPLQMIANTSRCLLLIIVVIIIVSNRLNYHIEDYLESHDIYFHKMFAFYVTIYFLLKNDYCRVHPNYVFLKIKIKCNDKSCHLWLLIPIINSDHHC